MIMSLHVIMKHAHQMIRSCPFPPGLASEEPSECSNKGTKDDRLHRARRNSVENNLLDVFTRATRKSDPEISRHMTEHIVKNRKKLAITKEVAECLMPIDPEFFEVEVVSAEQSAQLESDPESDAESEMDLD